MTNVRIREYEPADHAAVVALVVKVLTEHGFGFQLEDVEKDLAGLRGGAPSAGDSAAPGRYAGARAGFWVAEDGGAVVGTVAVREKEGPTCELKRLYLLGGQRGKGVGQALYAHAEAFARRVGYERMWLLSSRRFAKAHRLYERSGFVLLEEIDNDWEDNIYEKVLGGSPA